MNECLIIIPTYNEKDNIKNIIQTIFLIDSKYDILVVDDNSPDGTFNIVKSLQKKFPNRLYLEIQNNKTGLGKAYILGFKWALKREYNYIFEMDADFSHNPQDIPKLLNACKNDNVDLAIGSRYCLGVNVVNWPMKRVLLSYLASKYVRFITGLPIHDATAGFICFNRKVLEEIELEKISFVGYAFQIEIKFVAWKKGYKLKEVPIIFTERRKGKSKLSKNIFREAVLGVLKLKISSWFK